MKKIKRLLAVLTTIAGISGCTIFTYSAATNEKTKIVPVQLPSQTSFVLRKQREAKNCDNTRVIDPKRQKDVLVLLALSGGGSRAAYFAALAMLEMQKIKLKIENSDSDVLHEVDAISSVSGGSLAGAYYAISHDPESECAAQSNRLWNVDDDSQIRKLMTKNYVALWIGNWFWPANIAAFWFSNYDRTDIMAQTLADNLFDKKTTGIDLTFGELNGLRPNLILNTTNGTRNGADSISFGQLFTFTDEDFARICSSIQEYSIGRAVMASATFPGAFNFMTLKNHCRSSGNTTRNTRYLHIFDGGNADNLGLTSLKRVIWKSLVNHDMKPRLPYQKIVVIQVDAFTDSRGVSPSKADPRDFFDYILDTNFLDTMDSLLEINRHRLLREFTNKQLFPFSTEMAEAWCAEFLYGADVNSCRQQPDSYWSELNSEIKRKLEFVHLTFDQVGDAENCKDDVSSRDCLRRQLHRVATDFKFKTALHRGTELNDADAIACAVPSLFPPPQDLTDRNDFMFCGNLRITRKSNLVNRWKEIKEILQNPSPGS